MNKKLMYAVIAFAIIAFLAYQYEFLGNLILSILTLLSPFVIGVGIAFVLNIPMSLMEDTFLKKVTKKQAKRLMSFTFTLLLALAIIAGMILLVVPELINTFSTIIELLPTSVEETQSILSDIAKPFSSTLSDQILAIEIDVVALEEEILQFITTFIPNHLNQGIDVFGKVINVVTNILIGFVFAIYLLFSKETLIRQLKKFVNAYMSKRVAHHIHKIYHLCVRTFKSFFTGQFLEAMILGTLFFVSMSILSLPYALLISLVIAVFALIPVFGAVFGCGVGILLIVVVDPMQAVVFTVLFLILQQIEGNLIYPKVVGNSIGLPSIWVFVAVILGASLMGILGMILFIPLSSVLYTLLREDVGSRLHDKSSQKVQEEIT